MVGGDGMSSPIDDAARMPLLDAAYALWRARRRLDAQDGPRNPRRSLRQAKPGSKAFTISIQEAIQAARDERVNADSGPTFHRLKSAHPEAPDATLQEAVKAAVKLETDCTRHYSPDGSNYSETIGEAVRLARVQNPGFSEATYKALLDDMALAMR